MRLKLLFLALTLLISISAQAQPVSLTVVGTQLSQPLYVTSPRDGTARLFVVEKTGKIRILQDGKPLPEAFLDVSDLLSNGSEQGLLGLAFHPDFKSNRRFFVNYTDKQGDTVVAEYKTRADNSLSADPKTARQILTVAQPFSNHNGGCLQFGPDGFLYIGLGDGGSGGDPKGNAQNLDSLLGKMLRIDVNAESSYKIPADNPFVKTAGAKPEIWAYGLRNPWRYSFDAETGELFVGDVGQNTLEEVDLLRRGGNYGWNIMEAGECFRKGCTRDGLELPITQYGRDEGVSITGGYVYRGKALPSLFGSYIFGDFGSGTIWKLERKTDKIWKRSVLLKKPISISSFGEDPEHELYVIDFSGVVYRFGK